MAAIPLPDGYGACLVTGDGLACALDWFAPTPPTLADLEPAGVLVLDHHRLRGQPTQIAILGDEPPPSWWEWLGRRALPDEPATEVDSFAGWHWLATQIAAQRRWDLRLPAAAKRAYREASARRAVIVDFGDGPITRNQDTSRLDLSALTGAVDFAALDSLPRCTELTWCGDDRGLRPALEARPIISDLTWEDPPSSVDLSGTGLTSLRLVGARVELLRVPDRLETLDLAESTVATVAAADDGRWLRLTVGTGDVPAGLGGVRDLTVNGNGTISAAAWSGLSDLRRLRATWRSGPGELSDGEALAALALLAEITLVDAYGVDVGVFPDLPALRWLDFQGVRQSAVPALRARYRETPVRVTLTGAKDDTWLEANLNNPFRDWSDDDERAGAAACKAYATALRGVHKQPASALRTLVDQLNRIEARYGVIDTLRREQAADAFADLAARAGVPAQLATRWFDEWREF